jgi:hypothetical protein
MRVLGRPVAPQPALGPRWQARSTPGTHHHTKIQISKEIIDMRSPRWQTRSTPVLYHHIYILKFLEKQK